MSQRMYTRLHDVTPAAATALGPSVTPGRLRSMLRLLGLTTLDMHAYCRRAVSRPQLVRILRGRQTPSPFERKVLALALAEALQDRSAVLFEG
ncbi:MAG: hypothetical protein KIS92_02180 [Planctomycetota bacterium]|nr:hypothetical protein [Planctomycetota bacterium]